MFFKFVNVPQKEKCWISVKRHKMSATKQHIFSIFFNYNSDKKEDRKWAEKRRDDSLVYLQRLFENKAKFSCIAKDEGRSVSCLLLRGYMNLNWPCTLACAKRLLGKFSSCRPSHFSDMLNLCRFVHVDRNLTVTGRLPKSGNNSIKKMKPFATDPKFVVKILLDCVDQKDLEHKDNVK